MYKTDDDRIRWTSDYSLFEMSDINRQLHRFRRKRAYLGIRASMVAAGFRKSDAITVCHIPGSNKLRITRGNNRYDIAKELGLPIAYIIDDSIKSPQQVEDDSCGDPKWVTSDWIYGYARQGNPTYQRILDFREAHRLPLQATVSLLEGLSASSNSGQMNDRVSEGKFVIGDMTHALAVVRITDAARSIGIKFATKQHFINAVSACLRVPEFDPDVMIHRMSVVGGKMVPQTNWRDYAGQLETVYNYGSKRGKLNLRFLAEEVMSSRQATFAGKRPAKGSKMPRREK